MSSGAIFSTEMLIVINKKVIELYRNPEYAKYMYEDGEGGVFFDKRKYLEDHIKDPKEKAEFRKAMSAYDEFKGKENDAIAEESKFFKCVGKIIDGDDPLLGGVPDGYRKA